MSNQQMPGIAIDAMRRLTSYKALIDDDLARYGQQVSGGIDLEFTPYSRDALEAYLSILSRGGKRIRGALVMAGYEMLGGHNQELALQAARIIEMMHAYVLIIDDIADRSDMRRGGPTAHRLLEAYHQERGLHGDSAHFGVGQAINAALLGSDLARRQLGDLPIDADTKMEALNNLHDNLIVTVHGQINDVFNEALRDVSEEEVKNVLRWKTAYYTFLNPLAFGMILAGADHAEREHLLEYSLNAGLSFQIIDDIIGMFGNEAASGKSTQDDLKEGKITLLIARALAHSGPEQKQILLAALGNRALSYEDYMQCRTIIEDSGALHYARELAERHATKAALSLSEAPAHWNRDVLAFLEGLMMYVTHRSA